MTFNAQDARRKLEDGLTMNGLYVDTSTYERRPYYSCD